MIQSGVKSDGSNKDKALTYTMFGSSDSDGQDPPPPRPKDPTSTEEEEEEEEIVEEDSSKPATEEEEEQEHSSNEQANDMTGSQTDDMNGPSHDILALTKGVLVSIQWTPDVAQRVPHTIRKVGVIEEVPQHPNTWYRVRIRDGDVVYKYRPSALRLLEAGTSPSETLPSVQDSQEPQEKAAEIDEADGDDEREEEYDEDDVSEAESKEEWSPGQRVKIIPDRDDAGHVVLKNADKEGEVQSQSGNTVKVRLDGRIESIRVDTRHLQLSSTTKPVKKPKSKILPITQPTRGKLLSTLDPELWVDRKCRINVGKFKGKHGRVLRSGNGWVQLRLVHSNQNTAKRAYELTLLEDLQGMDVDKLSTGALQVESEDVSEDPTEESGGDESSSSKPPTRQSRNSSASSWVGRKVVLPYRRGVGLVKKADRDNCTVEVGVAKVLKTFKVKELQLLDEEDEGNVVRGRQSQRSRSNLKARERLGLTDDVTLMGTSPARYVAFQDQVRRFVMRRRDKVKRRPNLQEWVAQIDLKLRPNAWKEERDEKIVDLLVVPQCEICGTEKEDVHGDCYNIECPCCPLFDVDKTRGEEEKIARCPQTAFESKFVTGSVVVKRKRTKNSDEKQSKAIKVEVKEEPEGDGKESVQAEEENGQPEATHEEQEEQEEEYPPEYEAVMST